MNILNIFRLIRPHHYIKNLFIFLPLFFAGRIADLELFINAFSAFAAFSITASAIYILNDYQDVDEDRQHPKKKSRPLASGSVSPKIAVCLMVFLLISGVFLMTALSLKAVVILAGYILINIAYTFRLKHIAILDVTVISIGFVMRLLIGSTVTATPLSMWIVIMTFLLAFFMALAKRRDDVFIFLDTGEKTRKVVDGYNTQLIDGAMVIAASVVIVAYILYSTSADVVQRMHSEYLYLTSLFVILGVMRYLQIAFVENDGGSPTRIVLHDRFMQTTILFWLLSFAWIIYL